MTTQNLLDWLQEAEDNNIWDVSTQSVKRHLEKIQQTEQLRIGGVVGQSEQLFCDCKNPNYRWIGDEDDMHEECFNCRKDKAK